MKHRKAKKRGRPPTGKRPVVAMRIHNNLYKKLCRSAIANKLSISEEVAQRINETFNVEAPAIARLSDITRELRNELKQLRDLSDNLKQCNNHLSWLRYNVKLSVDTDALLNATKRMAENDAQP